MCMRCRRCHSMPIRRTASGFRPRPSPSVFWRHFIPRLPQPNFIRLRYCDTNDPMTSSSNPALLCTDGLTKSFRSGSEEVTVLDDLCMAVKAGEFVALVGESGSGKTTLLHLLAARAPAPQDEVWIV